MFKFLRKEIAKYVAEFIGTMILVLVIKLSNANDNIMGTDFAPLAIGTTLMFIVYTFGYISWGMFNQAVTVGYALRNHPNFRLCNIPRIFMYMVAQLAGGLCGGLVAWAIGGKNAAEVYPQINPDFVDDIHRPFLAEAVGGALLTFTNIYSVTTLKTSGNSYYGLAIGFSLFVSIISLGYISGGSFNPSVWFGAILSAKIEDDNVDIWNEDMWIYIAGPFTGSIVVGIIYNLFHRGFDIKEQENKNDNIVVRI